MNFEGGLRRVRCTVLAAAVLAGCGGAVAESDGRAGSEPAAGPRSFEQDPIVFVHGCPLPEGLGSVTNRRTSSFWWKMYRILRDEHGYPAPEWEWVDADGDGVASADELAGPNMDAAMRPHPHNFLNVFVYDLKDAAGNDVPCGPIATYAEQLAAYVDRVRQVTRRERVDLVVNSFGSLAARLYIKRSGGVGVRDVAFLAGTNHGTDVALLANEANPAANLESPRYDGAREMFPAYSCAPGSVQLEINGCVDPVRTDGVDETPFDHVSDGGPIAYLNIFNVALDELVNPTFSACLNQRFRGDCSDPINVPIQVLGQSLEDGDTPHGAIRNDRAQAIDPTIAFVMARHAARH